MTLLPSRLAVADLAHTSVRAVCDAAGIRSGQLDPARIALALRSDRALLVDGEAPDVWSPLSGFWRSADGWVRTHGNYPHHAAALRRALRLDGHAGAHEVREQLVDLDTRVILDRIGACGGLAVAVRAEDPARDITLRSTPLVETTTLGGAVPRRRRSTDAVLSGIRVLDLTRVIAGPVCTRTLALLGADVLRIDPPGMPEPDWQHDDTGHGKRSAILDARSARFSALLADADVVVLGYRPAGLARIGLSPTAIAARNPGVVVAQLSAWGEAEPDRRGFDSLVQAESGIALIEQKLDGSPGALPAQALDHSAGYLLAAGVIRAVAEQNRRGGSQLVRTSLRRIAAELLGMPRTEEPEASSDSDLADIDLADHTQEFLVAGRRVRTVRPVLPGFAFAAPRPFGGDSPEW